MIAKILALLASKLLTEKFIIKIVMILLGKLVTSTKNKLDDELYAEIKKALD